jgi:hypothetical protein
VARIPGSHPGGSGSIPGTGILFFTFLIPSPTKVLNCSFHQDENSTKILEGSKLITSLHIRHGNQRAVICLSYLNTESRVCGI